MSFLSNLKSFFLGADTSGQPTAMAVEHYQDFEIIPMPKPEGGQYRLNGLIRKGDKEHQLIRADLFTSQDECAKEVVRKASLLIDQMGDNLFG